MSSREAKGSAEAARNATHQYRPNSNLVLQSERGSRVNEGTGEPETLWGKTGNAQFGDRAFTGKVTTEVEELRAKKKRKIEEKSKDGSFIPDEAAKFNLGGAKSVLIATQEEGSIYVPKTKETKAVYEQLLGFVQSFLGDQAQDVIRGAVDEILTVFKSKDIKIGEKRNEVESLLGALGNDKFARVTDMCKKITDFDDEKKEFEVDEDTAINDETGFSVLFDEESSDEEDGYEITEQKSDDDEDDEMYDASRGPQETEESRDSESGISTTLAGGIQTEITNRKRKRDPNLTAMETENETQITGFGDDEDDDDVEMIDTDIKEDEDILDPKVIDAFWIQRELSKIITDAIESQKMAQKVYQILEQDDTRNCENELVLLLGYQQFSFVKLVLKNRKKIYYCTKLAKAKKEEIKAIEEEMSQDFELNSILESLRKKTSSTDKTESIRKEARNIAKLDQNNENNSSTSSGGINSYGTQPQTVLDLDALAFSNGSHFMSNKKCKLPPGSFRSQKKGYEEVHIPANKAPPFSSNEKLVEIESIPEWAQPAFVGMKQLNRVQSRVYETAFLGNDNLLLCAPTGAGKTNVAILTILHEIGNNIDKETQKLDLDNFKIVYVAPMKSLVQEIVGNFSKRFESFGITVKELSGDQNLTKQQISETQIIVTTPEKWDIITRKSGDRTYTQLVKLLLIDEIHLLHDERGPVLESLVARTIRQIEESSEIIRLVGLSATLPNFQDVGTFLRVKEENIFYFDGGFRPVPLEQTYIGITEKKAVKRFQLMNEICYEKVIENAGNEQILIFVHSRKETAKTARAIRDLALTKDTIGLFLREKGSSREILAGEAEQCISDDLRELLPYGFAVHHAGLTRSDRLLVEDLFGDGHIQVLVSTATLAWGVNLPAHTVIIKGTQIYNPEKGRWVELSALDVMQMLGRAGRPAFDTSGEGIVITSHHELQFYLSLLNQQLPIESQFISKLADNLNAEIVLGTIENSKEAINWLQYTYLFICMLRSPTLYGIPIESVESDPLLEQRRADLIHSAAVLLDKHNLIKYDRKTGNFQVTDLGRVGSHYYVSHTSMATYNEHLKSSMSDIEMFRLFSVSQEFQFVNVRLEEHIELEKLMERVPIPIKESLEESSAKVNVLLQAYISRLKLDGFALIADMVYVTQSAARLLRALFEIVLKRGWAQMAVKLLSLCKMVDRRMWESQSPLRQFGNTIPEDIIKKIEKKDFPLEKLAILNSQEIGELIHYSAMGKKIYKYVHEFPKFDLSAHVQPITRSVLRVELKITPDFQYDEKFHGNALAFWILVEDVDGENILHHEYFLLKKRFCEEEHNITFTVPIYEPFPPQYFIRVLSDRWLGCESLLPISFRHLLLPEKYPPHTELLDLQPLPVDALKNKNFQKLYPFQFFNPIQTQVFPTLFGSDLNTLICAPAGSGKTTCAEFSILRLLNKQIQQQEQKDAKMKDNDEEEDDDEEEEFIMKCIYIAPLDAIANDRFLDWKEKFGDFCNVVLLSGETTVDLRLLAQGQIIISTPEKWDILSRRWRQRKNVQLVNLFIVDEIHLMGGENGHIIEIITSRMRYISTETKRKIRIVGLSASLSNGKDLGEWIGVTGHSLFNFHPTVRPVPLEIRIQGFDNPSFQSQLLLMSKPTVYAVKHHSKNKPVIIFVPSKKQCRLTAKDLIVFSDSDETKEYSGFLQCKEEEIEPFLADITNKSLKSALLSGIGFYHEALNAKDKLTVETLFKGGAIQILISTNTMCWGMGNLSASLVIIMGTQYYDGKEHRYIDYPITDVLQMMGTAGRHNIDDSGKCIIFCHSPKKDFYKKFSYNPLPIESHLDHFIQDHMNAEIVTQTIENKQDAVDYLTWTFLYRRLTQNPNYYNLQGKTHRHLSDHLSELVENTVEQLASSKCISLEGEDQMDIEPLNLGIITAYYYINYTTIELFNSSLTENTKKKQLIEILSSAYEFEWIPIRYKEIGVLKKIAKHLPMKIEDPNFNKLSTKINVLLQCYFSRIPISPDLKSDQDFIVEKGSKLLQAMVDVISSNNWLNPALGAMELSQMLSQAMWDNDSDLYQLPHFTKEIIADCEKDDVTDIYSLIDLEDAQRDKLLKFSPKQLADIAKVCNRYPSIEVSYEIEDENNIKEGESVEITVTLDREIEDQSDLGPVTSNYFPKPKPEGWWLAIGSPKSRDTQLLAIKKLTLQRENLVTKLDFVAPNFGKHELVLYFMSDSYSGCDQILNFNINVK